jgi:hypothetical protein
MPSRRGQKGSASGYSLKDVRAREKAIAEHAERAYRQLVADWQAKAPTSKTVGVAAANGSRLSRPSTGQQPRGRHQPLRLRFAPDRPRPPRRLTPPRDAVDAPRPLTLSSVERSLEWCAAGRA